MSADIEVLTHLISELKGSAALTALLTTYASSPAVFTHVPQDLTTYPYVTIYGIELNNEDTDATEAFTGVVNIHSWTDQRDMAVIGDIKSAIYGALHRTSADIAGYCITEMNQEFQTTLRDPDGITLHGVQRFKIMLSTL